MFFSPEEGGESDSSLDVEMESSRVVVEKMRTERRFWDFSVLRALGREILTRRVSDEESSVRVVEWRCELW